MGWGKKPEQDPRDQVGQNPTGRERRSSSGSRRQAARKLEKDLDGWKPGDGEK